MKRSLCSPVFPALIFTSFLLVNISAKATINGGSISLVNDTAQSIHSSAHGCYWEAMDVYNYRVATGGSGVYDCYWEENRGSGWIIKSTSPYTNPLKYEKGHVYIQQSGSTLMRRKVKDHLNPNDSAYSNQVSVASFWVNPGYIKFATGNYYTEYVPVNTVPPRILNDQSETCENPPEFYEWAYKAGVNGITQYDFTNTNPNYQPATRSTTDTLTYWRIPYDGSCGDYPDNPTNQLQIIFIIPINFDPGTISSDTNNVCEGDVVHLIGTATTAPLPYNVQWQYSTDSLSWSFFSSVKDTLTINNFKWPGFFRRVVTSNTTSLYSNIIKVQYRFMPLENYYGSNKWNVYAYNGNRVTNLGWIYRGAYVDTSLNIQMTSAWPSNLSPSWATNYIGCPVDTNNISIDIMRQGFAKGIYQLQIPVYDDSIIVSKDYRVLAHLGCCNTNPPNMNLGLLDPSSYIHITTHSGFSNLGLSLNFLKTDTTNTSVYTDSSCNTYNAANVVGYGFFNLIDNTGTLIASVNPHGMNLGTLSVNMKHVAPGAANIPIGNLGVLNMPRYFNIESSAYPGTGFPLPVTVRLYYLNSEFDDYKLATNQPGLTIADLQVAHYDGQYEDCDPYNNVGNTYDTLLPVNWGYIGNNAFFIDVNTLSFSEFGVSGIMSLLPLKWVYVNAAWQRKNVEVKWGVTNASNIAAYHILRSSNGISYQDAGTLKPAAGGEHQADYQFTDIAVPENNGILYYKIKEVDNDGKFSFSKTVVVKTGNERSVTITPNPANDFSVIESSEIMKQVIVADMTGRQVKQLNANKNMLRISMEGFAKGTYLVKIIFENGSNKSLKLVKQ